MKNILIGGSLLVVCGLGINAVQDAPSDENPGKEDDQ